VATFVLTPTSAIGNRAQDSIRDSILPHKRLSSPVCATSGSVSALQSFASRPLSPSRRLFSGSSSRNEIKFSSESKMAIS